MPSQSSSNRANLKRDSQTFPKILKDKLLSLLFLLVIPNFFMEVYYEGSDKIDNNWSWYHVATLYFLYSVIDFLLLPLIYDSLSLFLWQRGFRSLVVIIRVLVLLEMAHIWCFIYDFCDSMPNSYHITVTEFGEYLTILTLHIIGAPLDSYVASNLDVDTLRDTFDALFMLISFILFVWHSTREILLFRRLKLFERIYIDWKLSRLRRKLINLFTKFMKNILSLTGNTSEGFWNWPTNRFLVTILASVSFSVACI